MATPVRIRRLHRMPLRIGRVNISNSKDGTIIDLDDPAVVRDLKNSAPGRFVFVEEGYTGVLDNFDSEAAGAAVAPTTQKLFLAYVDLPANYKVSSLTWISGSTAAATSTNCWGALLRKVGTNYSVVGVSADDTAASPWAANTAKTFTMGTAFITPTAERYYAGVMVKATTTPTIVGRTLGSSALGTLGSSFKAGSEATASRTTPVALATTIATSDVAAGTHVPYVRVA